MDSSDQPRDGRFPRLAVDLGIIENNARFVRQACARSGIGLVAVVKSVGARIPIVAAMARGGCRSFASSRLEQLALLREAALDPGSGVPPDATTGLLRATGRSEAAAAVALADWSLQSEAAALEATAAAAEARGVRHGVTLMLDLGDLREGWFDRQELVAAALRVERGLPSLRLRGIGTNLGCYGAVLPTRENLGRLLEAAREVEDAIGRRLDVVSGGATTSLPLVARGRMPAGVNELRIGEAILCGKDLPLFHRVELPGVRGDTITLRAELLEKHVKPSYPIGARLRDAFGACPEYEDRGTRTRLLLGVGKRDIGNHELLRPRDGRIHIVGSSSDYLICEADEPCDDLRYGSILEFDMLYGAMLFLCDANPYLAVDYRAAEGSNPVEP